MAERSHWKSMSESSRFGIYREAPGKRRRTSGGRFFCSVAIFLVIAVVICLTALSITTGKGRKRAKVMADRGVENGRILINSTEKQLIIEEITTLLPTPFYNATEVGHEESSEPSIPRPEVVQPSKFPNDDLQEGHSTAVQDDKEPSEEDGTFASRQGRIMNEPAVSPYKMRSPPRFHIPQATNQRPNVFVFSPFQSGDYEGNFAQMAPYNNRYDAVRNPQEILDYAADDRPILKFPQSPAIKFTGVYVRGPAEEIENISLDNKKQLNGHAYSATTDPFKAYKPAHPAEINHLATAASELDTGIRFSNKIVRASTTPSPPLEDETYGDMGASGSGSLTQAIFHPYDSTGTSHLGPLPPSSSSTRDKKARPLKIMLDIYPLHQSDLLEQGSTQQVMEAVPRKVVRPHLPPVAPPPAVPPTQPSHMIVHLNLFPKKSQKNSQRRTTLPTAMTLVPGGGSEFQDRVFESIERPLTSVSFPRRRSGGVSRNDSIPDESIEIAESYPAPGGEGMTERDPRRVLMSDEVMEHSAPYSFVIGRPNSRGDVGDQDDGGGEGGVFILENLEELERGRGSDEEVEAQEETEDREGSEEGSEDHKDAEGEGAVFQEEKDTGNGYKVVSFRVSGDVDGVDDEVIDEGGILRARGKLEDNRGLLSEENRSPHESENTRGPVALDEPSKHEPEDVHRLLSGGRNVPTTANTRGSQNPRRRLGNTAQSDPQSANHDKGIRIKKIHPPRFFPQPSPHGAEQNPQPHDITGDDDKLPIGTVSDVGELDGVPGSIIEPRDDHMMDWWPRSEMLKANRTLVTTGLPIVFPTSPIVPTQTTEETPSVKDPATLHQ